MYDLEQVIGTFFLNKDNSSGKLVEDYFLNAIDEQNKRAGTFVDFMDNENIVIWDLVTDTNEAS